MSANGPGSVTIVAHDIRPAGGMEKVLAELVSGLVGRGQKVTIIGRSCELSEDVNVDFHRVYGPSRPMLIAYPWFMLMGSVAVRRWRQGIVQATGAIVANQVDVIGVHFCHRLESITPSRNNYLFRLHTKLTDPLLRMAERWCFRKNRAATFVCVSAGMAQDIRESYPELAQNVTTIHNGVDGSSFFPGAASDEGRRLRASLGLETSELVAAFVGGEWGRKGLQVLLEALRLVDDWSLIVAGRGDVRRYRELAASLGLGHRVHWLGPTGRVQAVYAAADAFVLPSSYETFSLVTFEAAASGLPIIATAQSGIRELLRDGENGILTSQDPVVIARSLRRLALDPDLRHRLGEAARRSALRFSWTQMVDAHRDVYAKTARS